MWLRRIRSYTATSLWVVPAVIVVLSAAAALVVLAVDSRIDTQTRAFVYTGGPESARGILGTISGAMITFTGLVFSITILVLQLASSQYSPRVLRSFFRDRSSKIALGIFTGTFTFSLIVLREVRAGGAADVPGFSVTFAVVYVLIAVGVFVHYLNHIARAIQVTSIVRSVALETREAIDERYPPDRDEEEHPAVERMDLVQRIASPKAGSLVVVDERELVELARKADSLIELVPSTGDFVVEGAPLLNIYGHPIDELERPREVTGAIELASERSTEQDPAFGLRQLVDIAERALSPGVNDPTTAVQVIDQLHDLMRRLAGRPFPRAERRDEDGEVRLLVPEVAWETYVELAFTEIRVYGSGSIQVHRRLRAMIRDILDVAPPDRRPPLERQLQLLDAAAERSIDPGDREQARGADTQGLGSARA